MSHDKSPNGGDASSQAKQNSEDEAIVVRSEDVIINEMLSVTFREILARFKQCEAHEIGDFTKDQEIKTTFDSVSRVLAGCLNRVQEDAVQSLIRSAIRQAEKRAKIESDPHPFIGTLLQLAITKASDYYRKSSQESSGGGIADHIAVDQSDVDLSPDEDLLDKKREIFKDISRLMRSELKDEIAKCVFKVILEEYRTGVSVPAAQIAGRCGCSRGYATSEYDRLLDVWKKWIRHARSEIKEWFQKEKL